MAGMIRRRNGAALVAVVLITLALYAIGHGLLGLALGQLGASRAGARHLEARVAADAAVHRALTDSGRGWMDSVAIGSSRTMESWASGRAQAGVSLWKVSAESWWVEGSGRMGIAEARTARLAWALDPLRTVTKLRGVLSIGAAAPLVLDGTVDSASPASMDPPHTSADCEPWMSSLHAHYATTPLAAGSLQA